jgi:hypothetical protein
MTMPGSAAAESSLASASTLTELTSAAGAAKAVIGATAEAAMAADIMTASSLDAISFLLGFIFSLLFGGICRKIECAVRLFFSCKGKRAAISEVFFNSQFYIITQHQDKVNLHATAVPVQPLVP